jgi:hypothetical protein
MEKSRRDPAATSPMTTKPDGRLMDGEAKPRPMARRPKEKFFGFSYLLILKLVALPKRPELERGRRPDRCRNSLHCQQTMPGLLAIRSPALRQIRLGQAVVD